MVKVGLKKGHQEITVRPSKLGLAVLVEE
jgi:hypothetical protein